MKKLKVYIAGPYTKPDPEANTKYAIEIGNRLLNFGFTPFIPHLTHFWHTQIPRPYEDWLEYDNEWVPCCDAMLRLPGESSGADKEVNLARILGIPVFRSIEELEDWRETLKGLDVVA